jgi:hypothetical protein
VLRAGCLFSRWVNFIASTQVIAVRGLGWAISTSEGLAGSTPFRSGEALDDDPATKRIKIGLETSVETKPCPRDTLQVETVEEENGRQDELRAMSVGSLKATEAVKVKATDELRATSDGSLKATDDGSEGAFIWVRSNSVVKGT